MSEEVVYNKDLVKLTKTPTDDIEAEAIIKYFTKEKSKSSDIKKISPLGFWYIKHLESTEVSVKHYLVLSKNTRYEISYPVEKDFVPEIDLNAPEGLKLFSEVDKLMKLISGRGITRLTELYKGTDNISPRSFKQMIFTELFKKNG